MPNFNSDWAQAIADSKIRQNVKVNATLVQQERRTAVIRVTFTGTEAVNDTITLGPLGVNNHRMRVDQIAIRYAGTAWAGSIGLALKVGKSITDPAAATLGSQTVAGGGSVGTIIPTGSLVLAKRSAADVYFFTITAKTGGPPAGAVIELEIPYYFEGI